MYVQEFEFEVYKIPRPLWADLNGPLWWEFRRQCWEKNRLVLKALKGRNAVSWIGLCTVKKQVHLKGGSLDWEFFWRVYCLKATTWRSVSSGSASKKYRGWRSNCGSSGWGSIPVDLKCIAHVFQFCRHEWCRIVRTIQSSTWGQTRCDTMGIPARRPCLEAVEVKPALHSRPQNVGDIRTWTSTAESFNHGGGPREK